MKANNRSVDTTSKAHDMQITYAPYTSRNQNRQQQHQQPLPPRDTSDRNTIAMPGFIRTPHGWYRSPYHPHSQGMNTPLYDPYRRPQEQYTGPVSAAPQMYRDSTSDQNRKVSGSFPAPTFSAQSLAGPGSRLQSNDATKSNAAPEGTHISNEKRYLSRPLYPHPPNEVTSSRIVRASVNCIPVRNSVNATGQQHHPNQALLDVTNQGNGTRKMIIMKKASNLEETVSNLETETESTHGEFSPIPEDETHATKSTMKRCVDDLQSLTSASSCSPSTVPSVVSEPGVKRHRSSFDGTVQCSVATSTSHHPPRGMLDLLCQAATIVTDRMEHDKRNFRSAKEASPIPKVIINRMSRGKRNFRSSKGASPIPKVIINHTPMTQTGRENGNSNKSCNCPRSRCIKLYCECFQSGNYCSPQCCCKNCENNALNAGSNGPRTRAIQNILSRNPFAFHKNKLELEKKNNSAEGVNCRCVKSQCLKLYCECFQSGTVCGEYCMCVKCLNTVKESTEHGRRTTARSLALMKKPDAFKKKVKEVGAGCSCKNSKCLKKYCDCFNSGLACSPKCACRDCQNVAPETLKGTQQEKAASAAAVLKTIN